MKEVMKKNRIWLRIILLLIIQLQITINFSFAVELDNCTQNNLEESRTLSPQLHIDNFLFQNAFYPMQNGSTQNDIDNAQQWLNNALLNGDGEFLLAKVRRYRREKKLNVSEAKLIRTVIRQNTKNDFAERTWSAKKERVFLKLHDFIRDEVIEFLKRVPSGFDTQYYYDRINRDGFLNTERYSQMRKAIKEAEQIVLGLERLHGLRDMVKKRTIDLWGLEYRKVLMKFFYMTNQFKLQIWKNDIAYLKKEGKSRSKPKRRDVKELLADLDGKLAILKEDVEKLKHESIDEDSRVSLPEESSGEKEEQPRFQEDITQGEKTLKDPISKIAVMNLPTDDWTVHSYLNAIKQAIFYVEQGKHILFKDDLQEFICDTPHKAIVKIGMVYVEPAARLFRKTLRESDQVTADMILAIEDLNGHFLRTIPTSKDKMSVFINQVLAIILRYSIGIPENDDIFSTELLALVAIEQAI